MHVVLGNREKKEEKENIPQRDYIMPVSSIFQAIAANVLYA